MYCANQGTFAFGKLTVHILLAIGFNMETVTYKNLKFHG